MPTQTRTFQRKYIAQATAHGDLGNLFWLVEYRKLGTQEWQSACYPLDAVPVVAVDPHDPGNRHAADLLMHFFKQANPTILDWAIALTRRDVLNQVPWYEWGEPVACTYDFICAQCAQVHHLPWCEWEATGFPCCPNQGE